MEKEMATHSRRADQTYFCLKTFEFAFQLPDYLQDIHPVYSLTSFWGDFCKNKPIHSVDFWHYHYVIIVDNNPLTWRIQKTKESGRLQSMGSQRVRQDWEPITHTCQERGFPGGTSGQVPTCQCRRHSNAGSIPGSENSSGGEHSNSLQYSCLENPVDRGVWRATVHGVTESIQTRLSN